MNLKELEEKGVDIDTFINKHKFLHAIPYILDELLESIKEDYEEAGMYKFKIKHNLKPIIEKCEKYEDYFWEKIAQKSKLAGDQYVDLGDELYHQLINNKQIWTKYLDQKDNENE